MAGLLGAADDLAVTVNALEFLTDPDESDSNQNFRELMQAQGFREQENAGFDNVQLFYDNDTDHQSWHFIPLD